MFRELTGAPESAYWFGQQTTGFESAFYVGTVPLILAFIGLAAGRRLRGLGAWWAVVVTSLALATMPRWWPQGYAAVLMVPGLNLFRCPARYTAVASFGLALMAGAGFDATITRRRFGLGLAAAIGFGAAGVVWAFTWFSRFAAEFNLAEARWLAPLGWTVLAWSVGVGVVILWKARRVGPWLLVGATAVELGGLYYQGTTQWGWAIPLPESSPTLDQLADEDSPDSGLVAGVLDNLPIRAGWATGSPYVGFPMLPPNDLLELAQARRGDPLSRAWSRSYGRRWLQRLGVSRGVWVGLPPAEGFTPILAGYDLALDVLAYRPADAPANRIWTLYRLDDPFPPARPAIRAIVLPGRDAIVEALSTADHDDDAFYLPADLPESGRDAPRAHHAKILEWDGRSGTIASDGACDVILRRSYYPGWTYRVASSGPGRPIARADGGFQALRFIEGGTRRFRVHYEPTHWPLFRGLSIAATAAAIAGLGLAGFQGRRNS